MLAAPRLPTEPRVGGSSRGRGPRVGLTLLFGVLLAGSFAGCGHSGACHFGEVVEYLLQFPEDSPFVEGDPRGTLFVANSGTGDRITRIEITGGRTFRDQDVDLGPDEDASFGLEEDFYDVIVFWEHATPSHHRAYIGDDSCETIHAGR